MYLWFSYLLEIASLIDISISINMKFLIDF